MVWAGVMSRRVVAGVVELVGWKRYVLGCVDRGSLIVELESTGCRGNLAVNLPYVDAEVVGVEDGDLFSVRELRAQGD